MTSPLSEHDRKRLGEFLRSHRESASPAGDDGTGDGTGSAATGPSQTTGASPTASAHPAGLSREEVAQLSGTSLTWYTWLEQGRPSHISEQALRALAAALGLGPAERDELFALAGRQPPSETPRPQSTVSRDLQAFLDSLDPTPAFVIDRCFDILAWNRAEAALHGGLHEDRPHTEFNVLWLMFNDERLQQLVPHWQTEAAWLAGMLRAQSAYELDNPRFAEVVASLQRASPLFRELWNAETPATPDRAQPARPSLRLFRHPIVGDLELTYVRLAVEDDPGRSVVAHFATPGTVSAERLRGLLRPPGSA
ncbi:helix-turn-helix transcriptional regulator [Streptomyces sp. H27-D2]|uniref:helix-turn-helix transcriptional regulator n=1 Tax=Streptomyces sp. H27-D2 TaxID=3046304 RepID=UPI002DB66DDA|nr:helix-turn-helix transcriptional regulator [Streptomyces sp. H27-D2]MEC4017776.1 helix-turn-helix transcriptional regulator [Streptomyces sp. H27-D2]